MGCSSQAFLSATKLNGLKAASASIPSERDCVTDTMRVSRVSRRQLRFGCDRIIMKKLGYVSVTAITKKTPVAIPQIVAHI